MCFIRLVLDSYIRQKACALWNSVKSRYFTMANGVKQGGVISPIFFSLYNSIIFNNKKTVCIKFGKEIVKNEEAVLNTHFLKWVDKVKHLGKYMNKYCNEVADCNFKKSLFIGYINKLRSNFGKMQLSTLISLFKSYCCSFYGSHLWNLIQVDLINVVNCGILLYVFY